MARVVSSASVTPTDLYEWDGGKLQWEVIGMGTQFPADLRAVGYGN